MKKRNIIVLMTTVAIGWLTLGQADTHDQARELRDKGEILPLETLLEKARAEYPGKVLEVELEREHGGYQYEIEMLGEQGRVWELKYDARSGELLSKELDD